MLTILTSIIGFVGGFVPDILKYFKQKQDNAHELEVMKLQIEAQEKLHTQRLEEINAQADIAESKALYQSAKVEYSGVKWVDAIIGFLNGTVRPVVAYLFVGLYSVVKLAQVYSMVHTSGTTYLDAVKYTYTELDMSCLMLVLSYYFGQRMSTKVFGLDKKK